MFGGSITETLINIGGSKALPTAADARSDMTQMSQK